MRPKYIGKVLVTLVIAILFGVVMQTFKGNVPGVRNAIGNLSVPWLLLPYLSGKVVGQRRILVSAGIGLAASMVALAGFYATDPLVWNLGHRGLPADVLLTLEAGRRWFLLAFLSGPVFGALGAFGKQKQAFVIMAGISTLIILERFTHVLYDNVSNSPILPSVMTVWVIECVCGLIIMWRIIKRMKFSSVQ